MERPGDEDHVDEFVLELLRTGVMLSDLAADLIEAMPTDAYPGEKPAGVVIQMLCGTIRTSLADVDPHEVRQATALIAQAAARTVEHLRLAYALSRRMQSGEGPSDAVYG